MMHCSSNYSMKNKFSLKQQQQIGKIMVERKRKFEEDKNNPAINKSVWNEKRKRWTNHFSQKGYINPSVRDIFPNLKDNKCDDKEFISAAKFIGRYRDKYEQGQFKLEGNAANNKYRLMGADPPKKSS